MALVFLFGNDPQSLRDHIEQIFPHKDLLCDVGRGYSKCSDGDVGAVAQQVAAIVQKGCFGKDDLNLGVKALERRE